MKKTTPWEPVNGLLAKLPVDVCGRLQPHLQPVDLPVGKVIYESNAQQNFAYFPRSGVVSLLYVLESGATSETAMVGNEGMVGVSVLVDSSSTPARAVVQVGGSALSIPAEVVSHEFQRGGALQVALLRYTQALLTQMSQTAVCNRHHTVEQQLCRWLLLAFDRLQPGDIRMTQEQIANLLGVRREGVTEAAKRLQEAQLIQYNRGSIRIANRTGLLHRSCECYGVVKRETDRLLSMPVAEP